MFAQFQSFSMRERDSRLKVAKKESERVARELKKDRSELERKEKQLVCVMDQDMIFLISVLF
jgi:hypothetical protein